MIAALLVAAGVAATAVTLSAQGEPALLVLLDYNAVDHGPPPHPIPSDAANDLIAAVGVRDQLPFFRNNVGQPLTLLGGYNGNDGWFSLNAVPSSWDSQAGAKDGLQNFLLAGPGLGSPDEGGERDALLKSVPNVVSLHGDGLAQLAGRTVCAVVFAGNLPVSGDTAQMNGATLGTAAFKVLWTENTDTAWPNVEVQILDANSVCSGPLTVVGQ